MQHWHYRHPLGSGLGGKEDEERALLKVKGTASAEQ
jgi:hypothetical protein